MPRADLEPRRLRKLVDVTLSVYARKASAERASGVLRLTEGLPTPSRSIMEACRSPAIRSSSFIPKKRTIAAWGFAATGVLVVGALIPALSYRGKAGEPYSFLNHFISELGERGVSALAPVFNASLVLGGGGPHPLRPAPGPLPDGRLGAHCLRRDEFLPPWPCDGLPLHDGRALAAARDEDTNQLGLFCRLAVRGQPCRLPLRGPAPLQVPWKRPRSIGLSGQAIAIARRDPRIEHLVHDRFLDTPRIRGPGALRVPRAEGRPQATPQAKS